MRILVTGATGFVGRHAVAALIDAGHDLAVVARDEKRVKGAGLGNVRLIRGDLSKPAGLKEALRDFAPEAVLHLAWSGVPDFSPAMCKGNLDSGMAFIDLLAQESGCKKWVVSGTCAEYGAVQGKCEEGDAVSASNYLGWSKQALYQYAALEAKKAGADLVWLRLFYVYGPHQRPGSLMPSLVSAFESGVRPSVRTPDAANDFVHVKDVAQAFRAALEKKVPSGVYNVGSGKAVSIREMCRLIEKALRGTDDFYRSLPKPKDGAKTGFWAGLTKTRKHLKWSPKVPLAAGIRDTLRQS